MNTLERSIIRKGGGGGLGEEDVGGTFAILYFSRFSSILFHLASSLNHSFNSPRPSPRLPYSFFLCLSLLILSLHDVLIIG